MNILAYICKNIDTFLAQATYYLPVQEREKLQLSLYRLLKSDIGNADDIRNIGSSTTGTLIQYYPVIDYLIPMNNNLKDQDPENVKSLLQEKLAAKGYDSELSRMGIVFCLDEIYVCAVPYWSKSVSSSVQLVAFAGDLSFSQIDCERHAKKICAASPFVRSCIQLIKAWNASNGSLLESFHIESMILRMKIAEVDWTVTLLDLFCKLNEMLAGPIVDQDSKEIIDRYLSQEERTAAMELCALATDICRKVLLLSYMEESDAKSSVIRGYSRLFGDSFAALCDGKSDS